MADYYKILGLSPEADEKEIRAAYRKMAKKYHPDAGEGSSAEAFRAIQDAYELLTDSEKKKEYDRNRDIESRRSTTFAPRHRPASVHMDLREVLRSSQHRNVESAHSGRNDPWDELLRFIFGGLDNWH